MNASEYQKQAARTLIDGYDCNLWGHDLMLVWNAIGLAGEAGEICDLIKKGILHEHGLDKGKIAEELSDVCWYLSALCTKLGLDLSDVMEANITKLWQRYPNGYSSAASVARQDVKP